jgi:NhaP-type Na+/H+ or K+/H+ antiporter
MHTSVHHEPGEALLVYLIALFLLIGAFCREVNKRFGIPYTPMLLVIGIIMGQQKENLGDIGLASDLMMNINPHGILMIFIPTIIFESAFNSDGFVFRKELNQILILAGPGVVVGAILTSIFFNYGLGYSSELNFAGAMTLGSIICATDPVAVVALLKETATPIKFNVLLEGESLLNDGTAMVAFIISSAIFKAEGITIVGIIVKFVQLAIGGPLWGVVGFYVATMWLKRVIRDDILTITITFMVSYLMFFVGEIYLGVSGILSIVTFGVTMSAFGRTKISPHAHHAMHSVWSFLQYVLETILFILTGLYIGKEMLDFKTTTLTQSDLIKVVIFYFGMNLIRYIMITIFYDWINQSGYPITRKDVLILTYGGLRGAIALSLALMVITDTYTDRFKDLVLFYVISMIFITILINGLTIKFVMGLVDFVKVSATELKVKNQLNKQLVTDSMHKLEALKHGRFFNLVDWEEVQVKSGIKALALKTNSNQFVELE